MHWLLLNQDINKILSRRERKRDNTRDDYYRVLFIIGQKVSLKDNHRGVIDKILAIQDRHKTNFAPYVACLRSKSFLLSMYICKHTIHKYIHKRYKSCCFRKLYYLRCVLKYYFHAHIIILWQREVI